MTTVKNTEVLYQNYNSVAPLGLICMNGTQELGAKINSYLERWADRNGMPHDDYMIECQCPRFQSGDAKGLIRSTVRGKDLFILVDVGNYSCKYQLFDQENCMSPDDHYQDLKRIIAAEGKKAQRTSLKDAIHIITANDQLKVYIGVVLAYNMLVQLAGGMALYYFKYVTGDENLFPYFTTAASVAEMGALFIFPIFSRFMNKKKVFAIASFTPAIGLIGLLVAGAVIPTNIPVIIVCGLFYKFGSGLTLGATTVMLADVIDYGEVKLGTRNESIVASFQTLLVKTASAVAGWLIGVGLTICGYVENVPQTATTIMGMRILMGVVPSIVTVLAFVIYVKGYKLDSSTMENITKQLKEKNKVKN